MRVVALSGGVGGAKLAYGLNQVLASDSLSIIANTGDDFIHHGLPISPDIDTLMYTLAGLNDSDRGWGLAGETWAFMEAMGSLGGETWFNLGDRDLAMHVLRREALDGGQPLSVFTDRIRNALQISARIFPMSDTRVSTFVETVEEGLLPFQRYFVHLKASPQVKGFYFDGADVAKPCPGLIDAIQKAQRIVICPSNPFISIDPILEVSGIRQALIESKAKVVAVSPIVGGEAIKGPTAKMFRELGVTPSPNAVAQKYSDFLDVMIVDQVDARDHKLMDSFGVQTEVAQTVMRTADDKLALAELALRF
jgi:LPPG:FO 2-phospho-L-lactate transferase